jgi:hypothetical protein
MKVDNRRGINQAMQRTNFRNATTAKEACQLGLVSVRTCRESANPFSPQSIPTLPFSILWGGRCVG